MKLNKIIKCDECDFCGKKIKGLFAGVLFDCPRGCHTNFSCKKCFERLKKLPDNVKCVEHYITFSEKVIAGLEKEKKKGESYDQVLNRLFRED